jgi:hypothetical protein
MGAYFLRTIGVLIASLLLTTGFATKVRAAVIVTAAELGGDVVFSTLAGGSLDLTGLTFSANLLVGGGINPAGPVLILGTPSGGSSAFADIYTGVSQPAAFGTTFGVEKQSSATGSRFGVSFDGSGGVLVVPTGYVSTDPMSATSTFSEATFASLTLTPGTYIWSWPSDSLTLIIPPVPIPVLIDLDLQHDPSHVSSKEGIANVKIAILGSSEFDTTQVDISTLAFGPNSVAATKGRIRDLNKDGFLDLSVQFKKTGIECSATEVSLTGETFAGDRFSGTDQIVTVGC